MVKGKSTEMGIKTDFHRERGHGRHIKSCKDF